MTWLFAILASAWGEGRKVKIWYTRTTSPESSVHERVVHPYLLEPNSTGDTRYLIGYDEKTADVRTFKLERITRAEVMDARFETRSASVARTDTVQTRVR
jgi:predicted DNA-binding transcriptional regulator YafY